MRPHGQTKLGFFPLPIAEAERLKHWLNFPDEFSALDPCVGDGVAFSHLLRDVAVHRFGIEIDANRAEQARALGIETLQANTMDIRCPPEAVSLLYLNPPYDWEAGDSNNQRLEFVFLEHTYRWLKAGGILLFVIPQLRLAKCARLLSEQFTDLRVFRLTEPACLQFNQIVVLARRRKRHSRLSDAALLDGVGYLEMLSAKSDLEPLGDVVDVRYKVPASERVVLTNAGIPLDEVEDLLLESSAYRQAGRVLLPKLGDVKGRPLTPLHGGHVGLLCTAGMLNGIFGEGEDRHIAHWRSVKFTDHWEEEEEDGTRILYDRERFSHELTLVKCTEKTTTSIKLRLDRFIGEVLPDPPRQAKGHLISVIGGDTQIAAISAAISLGDRFMVEGPDIQPVRICLERNAQCFKGSVQIPGRKKPLRHLVGLSEELANTNASASSGRTLLGGSNSKKSMGP